MLAIFRVGGWDKGSFVTLGRGEEEEEMVATFDGLISTSQTY